MTRRSELAEGAPRPLIDSGSAAEALRVSTHQLERWAQAGVVTAEGVDPDGKRWWNLGDLRRQVSAYLANKEDPS
jgi:hypothetical protein